MKFIFAHPVYLLGVQIMFLYKGCQIKVMVTRAKKVENSHSCNVILDPIPLVL